MSPRVNTVEWFRKLAPGGVGGDRAVQPGVHTTPTQGGVRIAASPSPDLPCGCAAFSGGLAGPFSVAAGNSDEQSITGLCAGDFVVGLTIDDAWDSPFGTQGHCFVRVDFDAWNVAGFSYLFGAYRDGASTATWGLWKDNIFSPFSGPTETSGLALPAAADTIELDVSGLFTGTVSLAGKKNGSTMFTASETSPDTELAGASAMLRMGEGPQQVSGFTVEATC